MHNIYTAFTGQFWLQKHRFYACAPILNFSALSHRTNTGDNDFLDFQRKVATVYNWGEQMYTVDGKSSQDLSTKNH